MAERKQITLTLPTELVDSLDLAARDRCVGRNLLIETLLTQGLRLGNNRRRTSMSDTDGLAAETRQLLDAATKGDWDQVGATVEKEEDVGWCIVVAECDKVADAALIAAAPRLLANWLAREDPHWFSKMVDLTAERDRLADENRALREAILDAATELGLTHEPDWASDKAKADGKDPVWCRICGPADGSWPCTSQMVVTDLLAAADRGVTDGEAT